MTVLTWGQLARALGVNRRSLHFWAQGERPSASNLERLMQVVEIVRGIDNGDPAMTTEALLEPCGDEPSMFAALCDGGVGLQGITRQVRRPPQLSKAERVRREGLSLWERIESLPDVAEHEAVRTLSPDEIFPRSE
ncbi:MAG: hypothetical protein F4089_01270 [Gammaproteobacteria bacterium]|nr:hypothetical protein [Acidimicrobiaceae bacterium]MYJ73783.1 hypothetical protein [Gammaproteobacteria bacterium]